MRWRRRVLDDLDDDIREHIDAETDANIARGMTPDEARAAARRAFGSVARIKEDTRRVWVPPWLDQLQQDLRYALRLARRAPGFTAVVAATLALGIGLTTSVFSVVNAVLLRPLAYRYGERLVWVVTYDDRIPIKSIEAVASPDFLAFHDLATTLDRVVAYDVSMESVATRDGVVATRLASVTDDFWDVAGATPALGRLPSPGEDAVMLSSAFFERAFAGDPQALGHPIRINDRQVLLAGVLPRTFHPELKPNFGPTQVPPGDVEAYRVMVVPPVSNAASFVQVFSVIGRMKPGVDAGQVAAELEAVRADAHRAHPNFPFPPRLRVAPFLDTFVGGVRRPLLILLGCVVVVLVIVCVNIANLQLARASTRRKEVAIRAAIGAGRGRVLRQFVVESLLLSAVGGLGGLLVARGALALMLREFPSAIPRLVETTIDGRVLAFAAAASLLTAMLCGIAPALSLWTLNVHDALKDGARSATPNGAAVRVRGGLVTIELALASVLVVSAVLLVKSFWRITSYPPGFHPDQVLTTKVQFSGASYRTPERRRAFLEEALRKAGAIPGVVASGLASDGDMRVRFVRQDRPPASMLESPFVHVITTSEGFAQTVGMRLVEGRWMTDDEPAMVYVINETLARRYFGGESPIGRSLLQPHGPEIGRATPVPIVGVVADLRDANLEAAVEPELYTDYKHANPYATVVALRTAADPALVAPAIRSALAAVDPTQPRFEVRRLDVALADSIAPRRLTLALVGTFAASALLLGIIGIYGLLSYSIAQRTQEIGVRLALGAQPRAVMLMVVRQGMMLALAGLILGALSATATTRVLASLLYDVAPTDPWAFGLAFGFIAATALCACSVPAMKASTVDPVIALRCE